MELLTYDWITKIESEQWGIILKVQHIYFHNLNKKYKSLNHVI